MQHPQMDRWNELFMTLPENVLADAVMRLNTQAVENRTTYRVWKGHNGGHQATFWQPGYPEGKTSTGLPFVYTGPNLPATPAAIFPSQEESLRRLGIILYQVVGATRSLMQTNEKVRATIGRTDITSEMHSFEVDPGYKDPMMMRIDYIWTFRDGKWQPTVVDINLLPGYLVHTKDIYMLFDSFLVELTGRPHGQRYKIEVLVRSMLRCFDEWQKGITANPQIAHLVREGHGLVEEQVNLLKSAQGIEATRWSAAKVVFPKASTEFDRFNLVFRQVREFWQRANPLTKEDEETGIRNLIRAYQQGSLCVYPPFALWQEDHQWFYWYRVLRDELTEVLGSSEEYEWFRECLPKTSIIGDGKLMTEEGEVPLTEDTFRADGVVKRGDSTSCHDLRIMTNTSGGIRRSALAYCRANWREGLIQQEFVAPSKMSVVALDPSGKPFTFTGKTKYSAYYVGGGYIGGNVMAANGNKVHGGSGTLISPVLTMA